MLVSEALFGGWHQGDNHSIFHLVLGENFFQYACGAWNKKHIIPEDRSSFSTFEVLADQQQVILRTVLEEEVNGLDNAATIKAKMFYKSCTDIGLC